MKKLTLLILLVSGVVVNVWAQSIHFGVSGGYAIPEFHYQSDFPSGIVPSAKSSPAINFGIFAGYPFSSHFSLQTGLNYLQSGFALNYVGISLYYNYTNINPFGGIPPSCDSHYTFKFLQLKNLLKYKPLKILDIYVLAGPQLNYLLDSNYSASYSFSEPGPLANFNENEKKSLTSALHRFNLSIEGGLGYEFHFFSEMTPYLEATYSFGLTNLAKSGHVQQFYPFSSQNNWRQHAIELKMGVLF